MQWSQKRRKKMEKGAPGRSVICFQPSSSFMTWHHYLSWTPEAAERVQELWVPRQPNNPASLQAQILSICVEHSLGNMAGKGSLSEGFSFLYCKAVYTVELIYIFKVFIRDLLWRLESPDTTYFPNIFQWWLSTLYGFMEGRFAWGHSTN